MTRSRPATFAAVLLAGFVSTSTLKAQFTVPAFMVPKIPNLAPTLPASSSTIPDSKTATFPNSPNGASFGIILGGPQLTTPTIPNSKTPAIPPSSTGTTATPSSSATSTTNKPDNDNRSFRLIIGGDSNANSTSATTANSASTASGSSTTANPTDLGNVSLITSLAAVQSAIQGVRTELAAEGVPPSQIDRLILQIITQGNNPYSSTTGQTHSMWSGMHQYSRVGSAGSANGASTGSTGHAATAGGTTRTGTGTATGTHTTTPTTTKPTTQHSATTTTHPQQPTKSTGKTNR